ncbi:MAG: aspartate kinase [Planctomycetota bacterium]|jgi:aspartate kinase|nr:aspartate kinase [Planctomycetota bacterium]
MTLTVVKVGGALLDGPSDLDAVVQALATRRRRGERLLVVVSAVKGVTDTLEAAAVDALDPRSGAEMTRALVDQLHSRHVQLVAGRPGAHGVLLGLRVALDGVDRLLTGIRLTGELTERTHDLLLAHGERLSAPLLAEALRIGGVDARAVTSEEAGLVAHGPFRVGGCDVEASRSGLAGLLHEMHDRILVLTGFYGVNTDGDVVLFGRGGTDYTAGVVAAGLGADALELWKDVPGFMSADPQLLTGARLVPELSFAEACELGYYGARILHPRCLEPLRGGKQEISFRSVHNVDAVGTRIVEQRLGDAATVAALAHRTGVAVVRVEGSAMVNRPGVAGRVFSELGRAGVNIDAVASSMTSLSFTIEDDQVSMVRRVLRLMQEEEGGVIERIEVRREVVLIGVVGDGVASDPTVAARMLSCLEHLGEPVELISHGPGDVGLSCAVPESGKQRILSLLHAEFFGEAAAGKKTPLAEFESARDEDRERDS